MIALNSSLFQIHNKLCLPNKLWNTKKINPNPKYFKETESKHFNKDYVTTIIKECMTPIPTGVVGDDSLMG